MRLWLHDWQAVSGRARFRNTSVYLDQLTTPRSPTSGQLRAAGAPPACSNVLSDIKLPQLIRKFTADSNYTCGAVFFRQADWHPINSWRRARFGGAAVGQPLLPRSALISTVLPGSAQMRINSVSLKRWAGGVPLFWTFQSGAEQRSEQAKTEKYTPQFYQKEEEGGKKKHLKIHSARHGYSRRQMLVFSGILVNL